ncbi:MAG: sensor histidine kinase [Phycisphaerae bacterium]
MTNGASSNKPAHVLRSWSAYSWPVVAAMVLALASIALAFYQSGRVSDQLILALQPRAESIAEGARRQFDNETASALRQLSQLLAVRPEFAGDVPTPQWPSWLDGILIWDGREIRTLRPPQSSPESVARMLADRHMAQPILEVNTSVSAATPDSLIDLPLEFDAFDEINLEYVTLTSKTVGGDRFEITSLINTDAAREEILVPLLRHEAELEVVAQEDAQGAWSVKMHRPFRRLAIQASRQFRGDLAKSMRVDTLLYVTLSTLSVAILLINLVLTVRVARRETALAELKADFVARVSHELKTPLALIRMFGETLQSGRVNMEEKKNEYYGVIVRESERLTHMIDNILDFARIDAGKQAYDMIPVDIELVVRETYEAYTAQLDNKGFVHELRIQQDVPKILADPHAIAQVLVNLMGNAIKYSQDEKQLEIDLRPDTRRNQEGALLSVIDRGIGIKAEDRRHLFEGYYRAEDTRVKNTGGTGLGLAVVKHIIDAHHGMLDVESRLVKGTIFRIFLPAAEPEQDAKHGSADTTESHDPPVDTGATGQVESKRNGNEGADHGENSHR